MCKQTLQGLREIRPYKILFCRPEGIGFRQRATENEVNTQARSILLKMLPYYNEERSYLRYLIWHFHSFYSHHCPASPQTLVNLAVNWRKKYQLHVTCYFISLLMYSTCFGHNISIIRSLRLCCWITTLVVSFFFLRVLGIWWGWVWVVSVLQAEAQLQDGHYSNPTALTL